MRVKCLNQYYIGERCGKEYKVFGPTEFKRDPRTAYNQLQNVWRNCHPRRMDGVVGLEISSFLRGVGEICAHLFTGAVRSHKP